jgi:hypothetical protein
MFMIASIVKMIISRLDMPAMSVIVCIDLYSLYECLGKLGITKEKCLIIDIIALR